MKKFIDWFFDIFYALMFGMFVFGMYYNIAKPKICKTFGLTDYCYSYYHEQCSADGKADICKYAIELYAKKEQYHKVDILTSVGCNSLKDGSICFKDGYFHYRRSYANKNDKNKHKYGYNAIKSWEKSCELKYSDGCFVLGRLYEYGEGVQQNLYKADELYNKACKLYNKENADMLSCNRYYNKKLAEFTFLP